MDTNDPYEFAYRLWYRNYRHAKIDKQIIPFLDQSLPTFEKQNTGWLKQVRKAQFLSTTKMAEELKISRSGYAKLEKSELDGTISLQSLAKAAAAMECELVYAIRPKNKLKFSEIVWMKLLPDSLQHPWFKSQPDKLKLRCLATIAMRKMEDIHFRRKQGWSERKL